MEAVQHAIEGDSPSRASFRQNLEGRRVSLPKIGMIVVFVGAIQVGQRASSGASSGGCLEREWVSFLHWVGYRAKVLHRVMQGRTRLRWMLIKLLMGCKGQVPAPHQECRQVKVLQWLMQGTHRFRWESSRVTSEDISVLEERFFKVVVLADEEIDQECSRLQSTLLHKSLGKGFPLDFAQKDLKI